MDSFSPTIWQASNAEPATFTPASSNFSEAGQNCWLSTACLPTISQDMFQKTEGNIKNIS